MLLCVSLSILDISTSFLPVFIGFPLNTPLRKAIHQENPQHYIEGLQVFDEPGKVIEVEESHFVPGIGV